MLVDRELVGEMVAKVVKRGLCPAFLCSTNLLSRGGLGFLVLCMIEMLDITEVNCVYCYRFFIWLNPLMKLPFRTYRHIKKKNLLISVRRI